MLAKGNDARTTRSTSAPVISPGLILQTMARYSRRVRRAPKRSLIVRGLLTNRISLISPPADGLAHPRHFDGGLAPLRHRLLERARIAPRLRRDLVEPVQYLDGKTPAAGLQRLAELLGIAGADDRRGHERLVHHPAQRHLGRRLAELFRHIEQRLQDLAMVGSEEAALEAPALGGAAALHLEAARRVLAGEIAAAHGRPGHAAQPLELQHGHDLLVDVAHHQAVLRLIAGELLPAVD